MAACALAVGPRVSLFFLFLPRVVFFFPLATRASMAAAAAAAAAAVAAAAAACLPLFFLRFFFLFTLTPSLAESAPFFACAPALLRPQPTPTFQIVQHHCFPHPNSR